MNNTNFIAKISFLLSPFKKQFKCLVFLIIFAIDSSVLIGLSNPKSVKEQSSLTDNIVITSDIQITDSKTGVVTAVGNVRIFYPKTGFTSNSMQAQYYSNESVVVLSGKVNLSNKEGDKLRADRLVYMIEEDQVIADSTPKTFVYSEFKLQGNSKLLNSINP